MKLMNGLLINVRSEEEMEELLSECERQGIKWASSRPISAFNPYYIHREETCIVIHDDFITYESVNSHRFIERELILYSDLKKEK